MDAATLQERIDRIGYATQPEGDWFPTEPLFLDKQCAFVNTTGPRSVMRCNFSGSAFVVGVERGRVPDDRFVHNVGFRTGAGDDHIHVWQPDGDWVVGPSASVNGWLGVRKLRVQFAGICHDNGGDFSGAGLCGLQGPDTVAPDPQPWNMHAADGKVFLELRTFAGKHTYSVPLPAGPDLDVVFEVDLVAGTVTSSLGTTTAANLPLVPNAFLYSNLNHGFSAGSLRPWAGGRGYFGSANRDMTVRFVNVRYNDGALGSCHLYAGNGRFGSPSFDPALSLPLIPQVPGGFMYLVAIEPTGWRGGDVEIRGVRAQGRDGTAVIARGWVEGGLLLRDVHLQGGTRSYTTIGVDVGYPVTIDHCNFSHPSDCAVYAFRDTVGSVIRDTQFKYARRCSVHSIDSHLKLFNVMDQPPGNEQDCVLLIEGGKNVIRDYEGDYEYDLTPAFRFMKVRGRTMENHWPTTVDAKRVTFRAPNAGPVLDDALIAEELPRQAGYKGAVVVTLDGRGIL